MNSNRRPMRAVRNLALLAAVAAVAAVSGGIAATAQSHQVPADPDNPLALRGCVIRFDQQASNGDTWPRIHANSGHICVGVDAVASDYSTGDLVITHDSDEHRPVVSIAVSPDETLVARGIDCGASGGINWTRIRCYDRDGTRVKPWSAAIRGDYSNLWIMWISWAG